MTREFLWELLGGVLDEEGRRTKGGIEKKGGERLEQGPKTRFITRNGLGQGHFHNGKGLVG